MCREENQLNWRDATTELKLTPGIIHTQKSSPAKFGTFYLSFALRNTSFEDSKIPNPIIHGTLCKSTNQIIFIIESSWRNTNQTFLYKNNTDLLRFKIWIKRHYFHSNSPAIAAYRPTSTHPIWFQSIQLMQLACRPMQPVILPLTWKKRKETRCLEPTTKTTCIYKRRYPHVSSQLHLPPHLPWN